MKGLIFAAGLGTRLRPFTLTRPKALVEVGGVTMLDRVIQSIQEAGISDIVVNACYFAGQIEDFLDGRGIKVSVEPGESPLETGGGIRFARPLLEGCDRFLVHNADILSNLDLGSFVTADAALRNGSNPLASLLVTDKPADRKLLFDGQMRLMGWTNLRTGEVKSPFPDFHPELYRQLSFCGIHIISEDILPMMEDWPERFGIMDFYLKVCGEQEIRGILAPEDFNMIDIGSPETLNEANKFVSSQDIVKSII